MVERYRRDAFGQRVLVGVVTGAVAGLAGTLAMSLVNRLWTLARPGGTNPHEKTLFDQGGRPDVEEAKKRGMSAGRPEAVATTEAAERIARPVLERSLTPKERKQGGILVHFAYGAVLGSIYGAGSEALGRSHVPSPPSYGLITWAAGIGAILPALRLAKPPTHYSLGEHTYGVVSHLVYGVVTGACHRRLQTLLS